MTVQRMTAEVLFEASNGNDEGLRRHVQSAVTSSARNARDGAVVIALYSEDGVLINMNVVGTPSEEMQAEIDGLFVTDTN